MAMQVIESNGDFSHLKFRANSLALQNKRRNEAVNEILRPPPHPQLARGDHELPPDPSDSGNFQGSANLASVGFSSVPSELDEMKTRKAANPFSSESTEEKAARHQREADQDIRRYKEERRRFLTEKNLEKKTDLQMLQTYYPWGRPGHGAPLGPEQEAQKKRKFLVNEGRQDATTADGDGADGDAEENGLALNRPGHGAPLRTSSGRLVTQLPGDRDLRFRGARDAPGRRGRDPAETLRYRNPDGRNYARELENHMQQQMQQKEINRAYELQEELNSLQYDPFGKPGSGAPNSQQQQELHQRHREAANLAAAAASESMNQGWDRVAVKQLPYADSGHHQPFWGGDESWHQPRDPHYTQSAPNPRSPLPQMNPHHQQQHHLLAHQHPELPHDGQGQAYNPFGRPGAGAPLRDRDGRLISSVFGTAAKLEEPPGEKQKRTEAARIYSQELERGLIEQNLNRKLEIQQRRAPVESHLAEQIARGSVGKPARDPRTGTLLDQRLSSSDVTHVNYKTPRHKFQSVTGYQHLPEFIQTAEGYGSELERAAFERAAAKRLDRARDIHEADRHADAFDRMFGRPGAGAPGPAGPRKVNLDMALNHPDGMRNEYKKSVDHVTHQIGGTAYVRNPTGSNHGNGYQMPPEDRGTHQYSLLAPYAIQKRE